MSHSLHRYSMASIVLHWLMLLLIAGAYAAIEFREFFPKGSAPREALKTWHFTIGLSILGLVWLRIVARLIWAAPHSIGAQVWGEVLAKAAHIALYIFMIGMPLAGWLVLGAEGKPVPFFGSELPPLARPNEGMAEWIEEVHELGGTIGYWLIGIHAAASLFHHYILRDHVLGRMLPSGA